VSSRQRSQPLQSHTKKILPGEDRQTCAQQGGNVKNCKLFRPIKPCHNACMVLNKRPEGMVVPLTNITKICCAMSYLSAVCVVSPKKRCERLKQLAILTCENQQEESYGVGCPLHLWHGNFYDSSASPSRAQPRSNGKNVDSLAEFAAIVYERNVCAKRLTRGELF
jgi:hypothetical protein